MPLTLQYPCEIVVWYLKNYALEGLDPFPYQKDLTLVFALNITFCLIVRKKKLPKILKLFRYLHGFNKTVHHRTIQTT